MRCRTLRIGWGLLVCVAGCCASARASEFAAAVRGAEPASRPVAVPRQGSKFGPLVRTAQPVSFLQQPADEVPLTPESDTVYGEPCVASVCGASPDGASSCCDGNGNCGGCCDGNCSGGCGADCGCLAPCCRMCPCHYAWVDGLILWRDNQARNQPLLQNLPQDTTFLNTRDLDFGAAGGVRAGLGWRNCGCCGWELNYLGLYSPLAATFLTGTDTFALPGDLGLASNNFFSADEISIRYTSQINSAEVNRVCCCCCCNDPCCDLALKCKSVEWLYGVRYLNFNENFGITATDLAEGTSTYQVRANNNLFGAQIGSRLRYCFGRWSVEGTGKAGIFGNAAEQNSPAIIDFPAFELRPARSASRGHVAFVSDLNLTGIYQLDSTWGVRAGYNLLWIEGVALAPDQLDFTNTPSSGTAIDTRGGLFLHGVNVGLEARW